MDDGIAMLLAAQQADAKMIVNHYRRYLHLFREARILRGFLDGGLAIPGESALKIIGTEGTLDLQGNSKLILMNREGLREVPVRSSLHGPRSEYPEEDGWQILLNDFIQWQDGGPEPHVCVRNALASTKL